MAELGDSLMLPKPGHTTEHLWVLITRPHPQTWDAIMVNVKDGKKLPLDPDAR